MTSVYDLSWGKTSFLAKLQLFVKSRKEMREKIEMPSGDRQVRADGYSALSSTYYSIVGSAMAQLKATLRPKWLIWLAPVRIIFWCLTWLPLGAWCYWRMLTLSNRMVKLIGYGGMSAGQCDIRQSILRRRGRYEEARKCIAEALAKNPEKAHTRGLLRIGLAEIYLKKKNLWSAREELGNALIEAKEAEEQDPRQAARIFRHCADIVDRMRKGDQHLSNHLRQRAQELIVATGAKDQLLKLS